MYHKNKQATKQTLILNKNEQLPAKSPLTIPGTTYPSHWLSLIPIPKINLTPTQNSTENF
jgi:hypothetical protein